MNTPTSESLAALVAEAEALTRQGRPQDARGRWERVLGIDPGHAGALNQLGGQALARGDTATAEDYLRRAVAAAPGMAMAHANLSRLHAMRGEPEQALAAIDAAIAADPAAWGPQVEKARLLEQGGQARAAGLHWGNALSYMPEALQRQANLQGHDRREVERIRQSLASSGIPCSARWSANPWPR